ncbi:MAG: quinolinate synthase NadA [Desulfovibrio sp.]|nr:quinolinate synthase NadA [Desulfovibrio sp.]
MDISSQITEIRQKFGSNLCILGHHYQSDAIVQHCDYLGDSLELARRVPSISAEHIVFCGVSFMGESAALLTKKGQKVYLPDPNSDCMMALMASSCQVKMVLESCAKLGPILPLAYVNTQIGLKAQVGAFGGCVLTSANAKTILSWALAQDKTILFLPDKHLARNTANALGLGPQDYAQLCLNSLGVENLPELMLKKRLLIWPGCCPLHGQMTAELVTSARKRPEYCKIYVHPECPPEVVAVSDGAGSTSYLIKQAAKQAEEGPFELILGTEGHLVERLAKRHADKLKISPLFKTYCPDMSATTEEKLLKLLQDLQTNQAKPVRLNQEELAPAKEALDLMLKVSSQEKKA